MLFPGWEQFGKMFHVVISDSPIEGHNGAYVRGADIRGYPAYYYGDYIIAWSLFDYSLYHKDNVQYTDADQEIYGLGSEGLGPVSDGLLGAPYPTLSTEAPSQHCLLVHRATRPNGDRAILAFTADSILRYVGGQGWTALHSGFTPTTEWEAVDVDGYVVFNNGIDLPHIWDWENPVEPIYSLREVGVVRVGTIYTTNNFLMMADVTEFSDESLVTWMNGSDPYGNVPSTEDITRTQYRVIWTDKPKDWGLTINALAFGGGSNELSLAFPCQSLAIGDTMNFIETATPTFLIESMSASKPAVVKTTLASELTPGQTVRLHDTGNDYLDGSTFKVGKVDDPDPRTLELVDAVTGLDVDTRASDKWKASDIEESQADGLYSYDMQLPAEHTLQVGDPIRIRSLLGLGSSSRWVERNLEVLDVSGTSVTATSPVNVPIGWSSYVHLDTDDIDIGFSGASIGRAGLYGSGGDDLITVQFTANEIESIDQNRIYMKTPVDHIAHGTLNRSDFSERIVGYDDLQGDGSPIVRIMPSRGTMILLRESEILLGQVTDSAVEPFVFTPVYNGLSAPTHKRLIANAGDGIIYQSRDGWFEFNLTSKRPQRLKAFDLNDTLLSGADSTSLMVDRTDTDELWIFLPGKTVVFDYKNGLLNELDAVFSSAAVVDDPFSDDRIFIITSNEDTFKFDESLFTRDGESYEGTLEYGWLGNDKMRDIIFRRYIPEGAGSCTVTIDKVFSGSPDLVRMVDAVALGMGESLQLYSRAQWHKETIVVSDGETRLIARDIEQYSTRNRVRGHGLA